MKQRITKDVPLAMQQRLALLHKVQLPVGDDERTVAVGVRLTATARDLHKAGRTIVASWQKTPDADIGRTIAALDELLHVREIASVALLLASAGQETVSATVVADGGPSSPAMDVAR